MTPVQRSYMRDIYDQLKHQLDDINFYDTFLIRFIRSASAKLVEANPKISINDATDIVSNIEIGVSCMIETDEDQAIVDDLADLMISTLINMTNEVYDDASNDINMMKKFAKSMNIRD